MKRRIVAMVLMLVVAAVVGVAGPVAGGAAQQTTETPNGTAVPTATPVANDTNESGGEFGAAISSFMQASAAETRGSVDTGMWVAEFARSNASERPEMVTNRVGVLDRRLERLEAERAELLNASDGNVTVEERAKASRLAARIDALRDAINRTAEAAESTGVNATRLDELRTNARNLSGPEVAALARDLAGQRGPAARGQPGDRGPDGERGRSAGVGNAPENASDQPGLGSERGTRGNDSQSDTNTTSDDGAGQQGDGGGTTGSDDAQEADTSDGGSGNESSSGST